MIMYQALWHGKKFSRIENVEVAGQTRKQIILPNGNREAKKSSFQNYFDSREDAQNFLNKEAIKKISELKKEIKDLEESIK